MDSLAQRLQDYLRRKWADCENLSIEELRSVPGGYSKETFSFDAHVTRSGAQRVYPLILRKDMPAASAMVQSSREVEHALLTRLRRHTSIPVPESYFVETSSEVFGEPAMIMERVLGRTDASVYLNEPANAAAAESVSRGLCELLAALHRADTRLINADGMFNDPKHIGVVPKTWDRYMDGVLEFLIESHVRTAFEPLPVYFDAYLHLRRNKPRPLPLVLLHGDVNASNIVFQDGKILSLLDWELAHIGDPREDLGWLLFCDSVMGTSLFQSVNYPGGFLGYYNHLTGFDVMQEELDYFQMFSLAKVAQEPMEAIKRRILGENKEIVLMYGVQVILGGSMLYNRLLGYNAQGH